MAAVQDADAVARIQRWLEELYERERAGARAGIVLIGIVALFVMLFTFGISYLVIWAIMDVFIRAHPIVITLLTLGFIYLLFRGNATTDPNYLNSLSFTTSAPNNEIRVVGRYSNINPLAADSLHSFIKIITSGLYQGPRMCGHVLACRRRAARYKQSPPPGLAEVLNDLRNSPQKVLLSELFPANSSRRLEDVGPHLKEITGTVFLNLDPPAVTLTQTLRDELNKVAESKS